MQPFAPDATVGAVIDADRDVSTFNNLVRRSGVIKRIDTDGPYTILAPTNAAFDLLPPGALGALVSDGQKLTAVMSYHVVKGEYRGEEIRNHDHLPTLLGDPLLVVAAEDGVVVGGAGLEEIDITATNGLVHKIDAVMFPGD
ncbi:MAG TPA: fasciclin domain-containing protein [Coriobacteriia bacterium]|nr:fasciclin domain-containing protein [Coriobacteriia bacterium]